MTNQRCEIGANSMNRLLTCILGCQVHHLLLLLSSYGSTKDPYKTRPHVCRCVHVLLQHLARRGQARITFLSVSHIACLLAVNQFCG